MTNQAASRRLSIVVAALALLFVSALVVRTSVSAFSSTTNNAPNEWTAGDVILSDDDLGGAMFTATNIKPGYTQTECITVTYEGSLDANVKLYGALSAGDGLDDYLTLVINRGSGGSFGSCSGFSSAENVYTGTLDGFVFDHSAFGSGAGTWAPAGGLPDDDMTYQFIVTLQDDNAAQGLTTTATFTWEAQNT